MRANARRNQNALLASARVLFAERGLQVPLEDIASDAGVGIATLYRRFPDRAALVREVARTGMTELTATAQRALDSWTPDTGSASWRGFVRATADHRIGLLLPLLLDDADPGTRELSDRLTATSTRLVRRAQDDGLVRPELTTTEVLLLLVAVTRPLPGVERETAARLTRCHLDVVLAGLRPDPGDEPQEG